ncbi:hypothetical protein E3T61_16680 [Cryobacterium lactosi]|uniref:SdpI family protein n=1 Tax=Cryobacterium lactosi TaxID=1259202 RepID=A0A4R9BL71_9MICO|nr:hypothetical protein E3T61_16680 [Cryobacterium lactosi]
MGYAIVFFVAVGLALVQRRGGLSRNPAIGIRTKYTLVSDAAWRAAHASANPFLIVVAAIACTHATALSIVEVKH